MIYDFVRSYSSQSVSVLVFDDSESKETEKDDDIEKDKFNIRNLIFTSLKCNNPENKNFNSFELILFSKPHLEIATPPPDNYSA